MKKTKERRLYNTVSLSIPIIFQSFFQILFGIADTWFVSFYSDEAVAAVGYANQLIAVILLLFVVISSAISVLGAQYIGAEEEQKAEKISSDAVVLTLLVSISISFIIFITNRKIINVLQVPMEIREDMNAYLKTIVLGLIFQSGNVVLTTVYRIFAEAKYAMRVGIWINLLNIAADAVIIFNPMGYTYNFVIGIALATVSSNAIGFVAMLVKSKRCLKLEYTRKMSGENVKLLIYYGIPSAGENVSYKISQLVVTTLLGQLGGFILSAKIYAMNVMLFVSLIPNSIGIATGILVGYSWGNKKKKQAYDICYRNIFAGILVVVMMNVVIFMGRDWCLHIFTSNKEILNVARTIMNMEAILMFIKIGNFMFGNSLKGVGDVYYNAILGVISTWIFGVGLSYILGITFQLGIQGIYYGFGIDELFRCVMSWRRWKKTIGKESHSSA